MPPAPNASLRFRSLARRPRPHGEHRGLAIGGSPQRTRRIDIPSRLRQSSTTCSSSHSLFPRAATDSFRALVEMNDGVAEVTPPLRLAARAAALFAASVGIGRFVYTPILPHMISQAGLSREGGALIATSNYLGYLVGAVSGFLVPSLIHSRAAARVCLVILVATLAAMPLTSDPHGWVALRFLAGLTSAALFLFAVNATASGLAGYPRPLTGWAFGGVGAGIVLSGLVVVFVSSVASWRFAWWAAAVLTVGLSLAAWTIPRGHPELPGGESNASFAARRQFAFLLISYSLEGLGYIIAGTFLVSAISEELPAQIAGGAWIVVGLAAAPSAALWRRWGSCRSPTTLLIVALAAQAVGIGLFPLLGGIPVAYASAVLFGATFVGISTLSLAIGTQLRFPRSVALLTAGYSLGQIAGPLVVAPLLKSGYMGSLFAATAIVAAAALAAIAVQMSRPRPFPSDPESVA